MKLIDTEESESWRALRNLATSGFTVTVLIGWLCMGQCTMNRSIARIAAALERERPEPQEHADAR